MPIVKPIKGHTSCEPVKGYLEKGNRALSVDLINLEEDLDWAQQMDKTRAAYGNDKTVSGGRVRTYNHYVLSPDPADSPTLEGLRDLAREWAERAFPGYQVAIVIHDDSAERRERGERGILHAHLIVNNTNLDTGKRLAPYLTPYKVTEISRMAQTMAKARGWHGFEAAESKEEQGRLRGFGLDGATREGGDPHAWRTRQEVHKTRAERGVLADRQWSWKEDLRCRVCAALDLAATEGEFARALSAMGVGLERSAKGDYLYVHPDRDTWRVTGRRLGCAFERDAVRRELGGGEGRQHMLEGWRTDAYRALRDYHVVSVRRIGRVTEAVPVKLDDVARALAVNRDFKVMRRSDYEARLTAARAQGAPTDGLERARAVMEAMHAPRYIPRASEGLKRRPERAGIAHMSDAEVTEALMERYRRLGGGKASGRSKEPAAAVRAQREQAEQVYRGQRQREADARSSGRASRRDR